MKRDVWNGSSLISKNSQMEVREMAVHHGKKISSAARRLAKKDSSKKSKSNASKIMNDHKKKYH